MKDLVAQKVQNLFGKRSKNKLSTKITNLKTWQPLIYLQFFVMAQTSSRLDKNSRHNNLSKIRKAGRPGSTSPKGALDVIHSTLVAERGEN